jgi:hypothetical protein
MRPITINLPTWMINQLEESARQNTRSNGTNKSVSAIIRCALVESGVLVCANVICELTDHIFSHERWIY